MTIQGFLKIFIPKKIQLNTKMNIEFKKSFILTIILLIALTPTKVSPQMIYSYFFVNSHINSNYLYNWLETTPDYPINDQAGPADCDTTFYNDPARDEFCVRSNYGLIFPASSSGYSYMQGNLDSSKIKAADPHFSLLLRIFVDPTIVTSEAHNYVKFRLHFYCDHFNEIGFDVHFISPGQIQIQIHTLLYDDESCCNGEGINFATVVPVLTAPTWVDASLYYYYSIRSHLPFYLTGKIYQTCQFFSFNMENLDPLFSNDYDPISWDLKYASLKVYSSQLFLTTIQFIGLASKSVTSECISSCINLLPYSGNIVPPVYCQNPDSCNPDGCCSSKGLSCSLSCLSLTISPSTCKTTNCMAQSGVYNLDPNICIYHPPTPFNPTDPFSKNNTIEYKKLWSWSYGNGFFFMFLALFSYLLMFIYACFCLRR